MIYKAALKCGKVGSDAASRISVHKHLTKQDSCLSDMADPSDSPSLAAGDREREEEFSRPRRRALTEGSKSMMAMKKRRKKKKFKVTASSLFAIVIFGEFLKELSAISLEHSIANTQYTHDNSSHIPT